MGKPDPTTSGNALQVALTHHQNGRLAEAEAGYRRALALQPNNPDVLHLLGILFDATRRHGEGIDLIRRATALRPNWPAAFNDLANALKNAGRMAEAIAAYQHATKLQSGYAEAWSNLGNALKDAGRLDEAIAAHHRAVSLKPSLAGVHTNLGNALREKGKLDEAMSAFRRDLALRPDLPDAHNGLGNVLKDMERLDEAIAAYRAAIALRLGYSEAHSNLGNALRDKGLLEEAVAECLRAVALAPGYAEGYSNLGNTLKDLGRLDEAISAHCRAVALKPDLAEAHLNLALAQLLKGDAEPWWQEYEWRWKSNRFVSPAIGITQPQWRGEELSGRTVLLLAEQGFGDTIQFSRYATHVSDRGANVVLEVQPELLRLMQRLAGVAQVIASGQPRPPFDFHCPLLSLPLAFGSSLQSLPGSTAYLSADPQLAENWRLQVSGDPRLKVGLAWAGNPKHANDRNRSLSLKQLNPLVEITGISFYSLQKGQTSPDASGVFPADRLIDWTAQFTDFAETAALIANLDLVISVDTSVAHLAAALGKPVWVMLPFVPDWRWLMERDDSPWYRTMRLFRQKAIGDWTEAISRISQELKIHAGRIQL